MLPFPYPPGTALPVPTRFDQFVSFLAVYFVLVGLITLLLPRPWFAALFRIAFPFMPEKLKRNDE